MVSFMQIKNFIAVFDDIAKFRFARFQSSSCLLMFGHITANRNKILLSSVRIMKHRHLVLIRYLLSLFCNQVQLNASCFFFLNLLDKGYRLFQILFTVIRHRSRHPGNFLGIISGNLFKFSVPAHSLSGFRIENKKCVTLYIDRPFGKLLFFGVGLLDQFF